MKGKVGDFGPLGGSFAPDEDFAIVGGGGEDVAVFGVCLWVREAVSPMFWMRGSVFLVEERRTHETHQTAPSCLRSFSILAFFRRLTRTLAAFL